MKNERKSNDSSLYSLISTSQSKEDDAFVPFVKLELIEKLADETIARSTICCSISQQIKSRCDYELCFNFEIKITERPTIEPIIEPSNKVSTDKFARTILAGGPKYVRACPPGKQWSHSKCRRIAIGK